MNATTLAVWALLSGPADPCTPERLPPGLHPAAIVLRALQRHEELPLFLDDPALARRPLWVQTPLRISQVDPFTLEVLLRTAGIHARPWRPLDGEPILHVTEDPSRPPRTQPFRVESWTLQHLGAEAAASLLNDLVKRWEAELAPGESRTRFLADPQGARIIARSSSAERLARYRQVLDLLDRPPDGAGEPPPRAVYRNWTCRQGSVTALAERLRAAWKDEGRAPFHVVPNAASNTLLLRLPAHQWPQVRRLLEELDPKPR